MLATHWLRAARLNMNQARKFSLLSTHASFPATMYRYQLDRRATLYDVTQDETRHRKDAVNVSKDGLVHAAISKSSPYSNGPIFMPNSRLMQQMLRFDFERYQEEIADGKCLMDPTVICVPRGTPIPSALVLWREGVSRFSLQPSSPMEIEKLNDVLSEFYEKSATVVGAEEWIEKHPYRESFADENEKGWMEV
ncbi:hypothetical protein N7489_001469 [Penicillium chrysogenum]|uniref:Tse2 ADP-ribosyltransferase toxin domain-containing protein n=1 Tax=Penicillium chrysogenum TaxID=5076 RepID=A0ABQ8WIP6_PENCH|nr:uncharacterized protein N7489_001469 [Penicillium chrysogenum]KAJ5251059.1 hypothetical protein N7489_001469 [Penicillium chrysogenum]KAJ5262497.1 hypothetical protein N7524_007802 [Penicillium chrysogenum]KAJ5269960.1 hypothetical protein N7505_005718 [Penicillium chrysogenum]KAJ6147306.1 hypothetical protein N7497_009288 [Penicillium chrysogenum]